MNVTKSSNINYLFYLFSVAASGAEFLQQQQKTKKPDQTKLEFPDFSMR